MNNLYEVFSSGNRLGWVVARDAKRAAKIAVKVGWAGVYQKIEVEDCTENDANDGLLDLLNGPEGVAWISVPLLSGAEKGTWGVTPV